MRLEHWSVVVRDTDPYKAPEQQRSALQGYVYGHPRFDAGDPVTTSVLVGVEDGKVRTKSGSLYTLGEVDPDYEKAYPNARGRLLGGKI